MAMQITGHPKDGVRKLNLRFRVNDPRYADIERLRAQLKYHQGTGVLLDALVLGARMMLEQAGDAAAVAADVSAAVPEPTQPTRPAAIERVLPGASPAPVTPAPKLELTGRRAAPVARAFSEGTSKQFAQYGDMD